MLNWQQRHFWYVSHFHFKKSTIYFHQTKRNNLLLIYQLEAHPYTLSSKNSQNRKTQRQVLSELFLYLFIWKWFLVLTKASFVILMQLQNSGDTHSNHFLQSLDEKQFKFGPEMNSPYFNYRQIWPQYFLLTCSIANSDIDWPNFSWPRHGTL